MNGRLAPESISLLLKPASSLCNLACDYCFYRRTAELYPGHATKMTRKILETVIRKTLSVASPFNSFCWQGGEPLLMGIDFFRNVAAFQKKYARPGQIIENSLQTNGLLLDAPWCEFLRKENFLVGVSLDGPAEIHNFYRKDYAGHGSFDGVMRGIGLMQEHEVSFNILCLLTDQNIQSPLKLYDFFLRNGFKFLQFIHCFETNPQTGELMPFSVRAEETGEFYIKLFDEWLEKNFYDVSIRFFEDLLLYLVDGVKASCCYQKTCSSYLVVEHNADCYPCDFFVFGEWKLGNLLESRLPTLMNSARRCSFARLKSDWPEECKNCPIISFCMGDCTRFRFRGDSGYQNVSEYCAAIKMVYRHIEPHLPEIKNRVAAFRGGRM